MHFLEQDIVVGRPRDGDDRVDWLIEHTRFEQALEVLDTDTSLKPSSPQKASLGSSPGWTGHWEWWTNNQCKLGWTAQCGRVVGHKLEGS